MVIENSVNRIPLGVISPFPTPILFPKLEYKIETVTIFIVKVLLYSLNAAVEIVILRPNLFLKLVTLYIILPSY